MFQLPGNGNGGVHAICPSGDHVTGGGASYTPAIQGV